MVNTERAQRVCNRVQTFLVILASALLGFAARAEASPFTLTLLGSGSGGGGGARAASTGGWSGYPLGLNLGGLRGPLSSGSGSRTTNSSTTNTPTILAPSQSLASDTAGTTVQSLTAVVRSSVASLPVSGSLAQLALGQGETLSVSKPVLDSMVNTISGSTSATSGGASNAVQPSQPHTDSVANEVTRGDGSGGAPASHGDAAQDSHAFPNGGSPLDAGINGGIPGSVVPDEMVQSVFTDIVSGIVSSATEKMNSSLGDVGAAEDPISAPEPATLVLVASALTLSARRLRRRR